MSLIEKLFKRKNLKKNHSQNSLITFQTQIKNLNNICGKCSNSSNMRKPAFLHMRKQRSRSDGDNPAPEQRLCFRYIDKVKALLNAHALLNAPPPPPIWTLKMAILLTILGKIPASNKRPSTKNKEKRSHFLQYVSNFVA